MRTIGHFGFLNLCRGAGLVGSGLIFAAMGVILWRDNGAVDEGAFWMPPGLIGVGCICAVLGALSLRASRIPNVQLADRTLKQVLK